MSEYMSPLLEAAQSGQYPSEITVPGEQLPGDKKRKKRLAALPEPAPNLRDLPAGPLPPERPRFKLVPEYQPPKPEAFETEQAQQSIASPDTAPELQAIHSTRRLGEETLGIVDITRRRILPLAPQELPLPEVAQLDFAGEDVAEALDGLDDAAERLAGPQTEQNAAAATSAEADASRAPDTQTGDDVAAEALPPAGWLAAAVATSTRIVGEVGSRLERQGQKTRDRAVTSAEIGVVAALLAGAIGVLLVGERRETKKQRREARNQQKKLESQGGTLEDQQTEFAQQQKKLMQAYSESAQLGEIRPQVLRRQAHEVAMFAHAQAEVIRDATQDAIEKHENAKQSQIQNVEAAPIPKQPVYERPPLAPYAYEQTVEAGGAAVIDKIKKLVGGETAERPGVKITKPSSGSQASEPAFATVRSPANATMSQPTLGQDSAAPPPAQKSNETNALLKSVALFATIVGVIWLIWLLGR